MRQPTGDRAPLLMGVLLISLFAFHQYQVWFVDFAFNAGGRYMLNGLAAADALIIAALWTLRARKVYVAVWIGIPVVMTLLTAVGLWFIINTAQVPGWHVMRLTIPY